MLLIIFCYEEIYEDLWIVLWYTTAICDKGHNWLIAVFYYNLYGAHICCLI